MKKTIIFLFGSILFSFAISCNSPIPSTPTLAGISVSEMPIKSVYVVGDKLDLSGLEIKAKYSDNTEKNVSGYSTDPVDGTTLNTEGNQTIKVSYEGKQTEFNVSVLKPVVEVSSIEIKTYPTKMIYTAGESLDTTGLILSVTYSDGKTSDISSGYSASPKILEEVGIQTVAVYYRGKSTEYYVTVKDVDYTLLSESTWWDDQPGEKIDGDNIISISFTKTKPSGTPVKEWNVDINDTGCVKCYVYGTANNYQLFIVGKEIVGNPSGFLFGGFFAGFANLTSIDFGHFDTSKMTNMIGMFSGCTNLTSVDLSSFDTSKVTSMCAMFTNCSNLETLNLSSFDTTKVTDMMGMFINCSNLEALNLSSFDTSKVTDMAGMFMNCSNLGSLKLTSFVPAQLSSYDSMFENCGRKGTSITINPLYKKYADLTELGKEPWTYSNGVYTHL